MLYVLVFQLSTDNGGPPSVRSISDFFFFFNIEHSISSPFVAYGFWILISSLYTGKYVRFETAAAVSFFVQFILCKLQT